MGRRVDIHKFPVDLEFSVFTTEEIKRLSVVQVITGNTFDVLGHAVKGGLYDSAMGSYGRMKDPCTTCYSLHSCSGHLGHIELNALFYNPFFVKIVHRLLSMFCFQCHKLQIKDIIAEIITLQLMLVDAGYIIEAQEIEIYKSEAVFQNTDKMVLLDKGYHVHPRIAELIQLLVKSPKSEAPVSSKTSHAIRDAIVHAVIQRPSSTKCIHCNSKLRSVRYQYRKLVYFMSAAELKEKNPGTEVSVGQNKVILADECRNHLREVYRNYPDFLKLLIPVLQICNIEESEDQSPIDIFFMDIIPVTPPKARPTNVVGDHVIEHPQTGIYRNILEDNLVLRVIVKHIKEQTTDLSEEAKQAYEAARGATPYEKLYHAWQQVQNSLDLLLDGAATRSMAMSYQGLKQVLEKKDGLIRKHMMGKRVNYAARTVITPDPNISVDEIGIPDIFAKNLTFPMPVTTWNVSELRRMVMNGPNIYPGAKYIQDERGYTMYIPEDDAAKRESMAKLLLTLPETGIKVVHRHLLNGDLLLLNRQPSLHRPSIMAHKARILSGEKTFRLHYSNCKSYNADFDGDEMNAHYPQSEVARSEAYNLVNVANNYLVPKDGTPLGGLIQDHVIAGVKLSIRGRFFNREDYQQLVFQGLSGIKGNIRLLPPALLKPKVLWSGKQVLSTIILNLIPEGYPRINLASHAKIQPKDWKVRPERQPLCGDLNDCWIMGESRVFIRKGELLTGVLDKQQYGATTYGFIHCMYELYGGEVSTSVLTAFTKVFTYFLQREGFSLGVKDILVTPEADRVRRQTIKECRKVGHSTTAFALELEEVPPLEELIPIIEDQFTVVPDLRSRLDREYKTVLDGFTNTINSHCLPNGLITKFPDNNLQLMVLSGAKGSMVNTMQISSLLGQIELEGKRPPLMISCKALPSFPVFETSPKAGGFIDGRFMTGIQPQDFFFHCMAGREGLIDTAVKTSRSGYLQRCLIKHLEGLSVHYDLTVRDSDKSVIQFLYGEDGLDILKSKFFRWKQAALFFVNNADVVLRPDEVEAIKDEESLLKVAHHNKKINSWRKKHNQREQFDKRKMSAFTKFSEDMRDMINIQNPEEVNPKTGRRRLDEKVIKLWKKANEETKATYYKKCNPCLSPATATFKQDLYYGSVSEQLQSIIDQSRDLRDPSAQSLLADVIYLKNIKALAAPGDPVGLLAAQSIGEPSTQMTLNTFHFAGRGEMNVTLGIPRLREILMLASANIKTPSMEVPLKRGQAKAAEKLRLKLNYVTLANVLEYVKVNTKLVLEPERAYQYRLHFKFLPKDGYSSDYCVRPKQILKFVSEKFFKQLLNALIKSSRSKRVMVDVNDSEDKNANDAQEDIDLDEGNLFERAKKEKSKTADNDDDSSDEEILNGDEEDATGSKLRSRRMDEADYDEPDDPEEIGDTRDESEEEELKEDEDKEDEDVKRKSGQEDNDESESDHDEALDPKMAENVMKNSMISGYTYDKDKHLWCEITFNLSTKYKKPDISSILRELAEKSVLHHVQNVKRAYIFRENDRDILKTEGINIGELFQHDKVLDLNGLYTNDIHAIARTYGIEAAAQVIIKEIKNVFKVYGIAVDRRHLSLIADYMTFDGTFQPMSRKGLQYAASPLQQMSFESSLQYLKNAASFGHSDQLSSPSSRLMVGLPIRNGTGAFDLLTKIC